ncbi:MAG: hypothetical protein K2X27_26050 [Candidatus Obscuribacterales bacterium]|nr:hypothetical protein [Candidatus Obscuribacterales bacterium]
MKRPAQKQLARTKSRIIASALLCFSSFFNLPVNAESPNPEEPPENRVTLEKPALKWQQPLEDGPDTFISFVEAISGRKSKSNTYELLHGVTEIRIEEKKLVFERIDQQKLELGFDTSDGAKFVEDWQKSKRNLEDKFGKAGSDFLDNIQGVKLSEKRIYVIRKNAVDLNVTLGQRKIHQAFDLKALHFSDLNMLVDSSGEHPALKDIRGVKAQINAPGFSFPVEVKEFAKWRLKKSNDIKVAVQNPLPSAIRAILFLPAILRFHFTIARKED